MSPQQIASILKLRGVGWSQKEIADTIGASQQVVAYHLKKMKEESKQKGADDVFNAALLGGLSMGAAAAGLDLFIEQAKNAASISSNAASISSLITSISLLNSSMRDDIWDASVTGEESHHDFLLKTPPGPIGIDVMSSKNWSDLEKMIEKSVNAYAEAQVAFESSFEEVRALRVDLLDKIEG